MLAALQGKHTTRRRKIYGTLKHKVEQIFFLNGVLDVSLEMVFE